MRSQPRPPTARATGRVDGESDVVDWLEQVIVAGVGLTSLALGTSSVGPEVTLQQWRVLVILAEAPQGATVSEVAGRIGVTLPATGRQLRRLERRGLVRVAGDERDHRATRAWLTEAGQRQRDAIVRFRRDALAKVVTDLALSPTQEQALRRLARALDRYA